jgi:GST-like protein
VLDKRLTGVEFVAGDDYGIADMAVFPWTARHEWHTVNLADFPNVKRWYDTVNARPAVTKGMAVPYLN